MTVCRWKTLRRNEWSETEKYWTNKIRRHIRRENTWRARKNVWINLHADSERKTRLHNSHKILICHGFFIFFFLWRSLVYYMVETNELSQDVFSSSSTPFYPHYSYLTAHKRFLFHCWKIVNFVIDSMSLNKHIATVCSWSFWNLQFHAINLRDTCKFHVNRFTIGWMFQFQTFFKIIIIIIIIIIIFFLTVYEVDRLHEAHRFS